MGEVELVEVIDAAGRVERVVTRSEMRAGRLRHRAVSVSVLRPGDAAVLVHQRAPWKDLWPSYWDLAFGGVCAVGESWVDAAVRELVEEAGVTVEAAALVPIGSHGYRDDDCDVLLEGFVVEHDGPFTFRDGEVVAVDWVERAEVARWAAGRSVCPDTFALASATWLRT